MKQSPNPSPLKVVVDVVYLKSVWVHAGHDVDPGVVEEPADVVVGLVVLDEVQDQVEHHLAADGLVAVHVGHVLYVRLANHVLVGGPRKKYQ